MSDRSPLQHGEHRRGTAGADACCGVAVVAADGLWQDADAALCRLLGRDREALRRRAVHRELFPEQAERIGQAIGQAASGGGGTELALPAGDDDRGLSLAVVALEAGQGTAPLVLLRFHRETSPDAAVQAMSRQQEYLGYGLSHDLRSSLRSIQAFSRLLDQQAGPTLDASSREHLDRVLACAGQAGELVDALLELIRIDSRPLDAAEVDLSLLADWVCAELADRHPGRPAEVEIAPGLRASGDERQLRTMLQHLLHNAWKFSGEGPVRIGVDAQEDAGRLRLRIRDAGIGFDPRYADKLFEPFRRLHGPDQGAGHGLGLAIARRIAERHGGGISARSRPGEGSEFIIELPSVAAGNTT